jgi:hypothetical protein
MRVGYSYQPRVLPAPRKEACPETISLATPWDAYTIVQQHGPPAGMQPSIVGSPCRSHPSPFLTMLFWRHVLNDALVSRSCDSPRAMIDAIAQRFAMTLPHVAPGPLVEFLNHTFAAVCASSTQTLAHCTLGHAHTLDHTSVALYQLRQMGTERINALLVLLRDLNIAAGGGAVHAWRTDTLVPMLCFLDDIAPKAVWITALLGLYFPGTSTPTGSKLSRHEMLYAGMMYILHSHTRSPRDLQTCVDVSSMMMELYDMILRLYALTLLGGTLPDANDVCADSACTGICEAARFNHIYMTLHVFATRCSAIPKQEFAAAEEEQEMEELHHHFCVLHSGLRAWITVVKMRLLATPVPLFTQLVLERMAEVRTITNTW